MLMLVGALGALAAVADPEAQKPTAPAALIC